MRHTIKLIMLLIGTLLRQVHFEIMLLNFSCEPYAEKGVESYQLAVLESGT